MSDICWPHMVGLCGQDKSTVTSCRLHSSFFFLFGSPQGFSEFKPHMGMHTCLRPKWEKKNLPLTTYCPMCTSIGMFGGFLSQCLWPTVVSLVQTANNSRGFTTQLCTRESKVTFEPHLTVLWILVSSWHQEEKKYCLYSEINS